MGLTGGESMTICLMMFELWLFIHVCHSTPESKPPPASKFWEPYRLYITNRDIQTVVLQCPPEGINKGIAVLFPGNTSTWKFRRDLFETTRYDCNFYWLKEGNEVFKTMTVAVFNKRIAKMCGRNLFQMNRCYWMVTQNGFYFSKHNQTFPDANDWQVVYNWDS